MVVSKLFQLLQWLTYIYESQYIQKSTIEIRALKVVEAQTIEVLIIVKKLNSVFSSLPEK